jgi:cobyrinic acid a,c-diamide synthase
MSAAGVILSAPASGSGKTTIAMGVLRALRQRGRRVAATKSGPDYIDPGFHAAASGRACLNLDPWAMRPDSIAAAIDAVAADADLILCEGAMGLFDGIDARGSGSSADIAEMTGWPVVLVVDVGGQAASVAALVRGFVRHRPGVRIAGVIFNRVGGRRHAMTLDQAVATACPDLARLGSVPNDERLALPERHLGLVQAREWSDLEALIEGAAKCIAETIDLDALAACATPSKLRAGPGRVPGVPPLGQRVAVAQDDAFAFAYPLMLAGWRASGAELSTFSPLADEPPATDADAIYLPGGYPELHAGRLANNQRFLGGLRAAAARGVTVYGECGGYMVLGRSLIDAGGTAHRLADLLPIETSFATRRLALGYRAVRLAGDGPLGAAGTSYRGHEFHYATAVSEGSGAPLFDAADAHGHPLGALGRRAGSVMGSFVHLVDRR